MVVQSQVGTGGEIDELKTGALLLEPVVTCHSNAQIDQMMSLCLIPGRIAQSDGSIIISKAVHCLIHEILLVYRHQAVFTYPRCSSGPKRTHFSFNRPMAGGWRRKPGNLSFIFLSAAT